MGNKFFLPPWSYLVWSGCDPTSLSSLLNKYIRYIITTRIYCQVDNTLTRTIVDIQTGMFSDDVHCQEGTGFNIYVLTELSLPPNHNPFTTELTLVQLTGNHYKTYVTHQVQFNIEVSFLELRWQDCCSPRTGPKGYTLWVPRGSSSMWPLTSLFPRNSPPPLRSLDKIFDFLNLFYLYTTL